MVSLSDGHQPVADWQASVQSTWQESQRTAAAVACGPGLYGSQRMVKPFVGQRIPSLMIMHLSSNWSLEKQPRKGESVIVVIITVSFKPIEAKQLARQGIEQNLPPKQTRRPLPLLHVSILLVWLPVIHLFQLSTLSWWRGDATKITRAHLIIAWRKANYFWIFYSIVKPFFYSYCIKSTRDSIPTRTCRT